MSNGLGRGLGSLIPKKTINSTNERGEVQVVDDKSLVKKIKISDIVANDLQPRKKFTDYKIEELSNSVKEYGVIQPLIVHKKGNGYELIAGERRFRAAKLAGLTEVPAIIREVDELEKLEIAIVENIQREDLNPVDLGLSYKKLIDEFHLTQEDVAKKMGKSRSAIANTLRLLNLPQEILSALADGGISEGHAKYLVGLDTEVKQLALFRKIMHSKLSVADTNKEIQKIGGTKKAKKLEINYADKEKEKALQEFFGTKVEIKRSGNGGHVVVEFYSDEELGEIMKKIN